MNATRSSVKSASRESAQCNAAAVAEDMVGGVMSEVACNVEGPDSTEIRLGEGFRATGQGMRRTREDRDNGCRGGGQGESPKEVPIYRFRNCIG